MTKTPTPTPPPFEPGQLVITPMGSTAELLTVNAELGEGLVQWTSGDRACFRLELLKPAPKDDD